MEYQFQQFDKPENCSVQGEQVQPSYGGMNRKRIFVLYGILVLLLLILLMVTGIKFSHLNQEITEVKSYLKKISTTVEDEATHEDIYLKEITPVRGTCRDGWVSFQKGCYLLSTVGATWHKAEEQCRAHGGHLLVLNNVEELDYISKVVELRYHYWIGLVEREHEGHWSWVDGTDFSSTPIFWDKGQPDNWDYRENGEDCGQLHATLSRKRKLWNDADCGLSYQYICESRA